VGRVTKLGVQRISQSLRKLQFWLELDIALEEHTLKVSDVVMDVEWEWRIKRLVAEDTAVEALSVEKEKASFPSTEVTRSWSLEVVGVVLQLKAVEVEAIVGEEEEGVKSVKLEGKFFFLTAAVVFLGTHLKERIWNTTVSFRNVGEKWYGGPQSKQDLDAELDSVCVSILPFFVFYVDEFWQ
jgi:hypothetical protein